MPGLDVRAGVKNLFDSDLLYYAVLPTGTPVSSRFPGRTIFVQLSWRK